MNESECESQPSLRALIAADWSANRGNPKARIVLLLFRVGHALRFGSRILWPLTVCYGAAYRILVEWILCVEIPWKTRIGPGLRLDHAHALVVNDGTLLGSDCHLRQCTTIGSKQLPDGTYSKCPVIGNGVSIGANVVVIGPVRIGDGAVVGAGAIVTRDVEPNTVVAGNPARLIGHVQVKISA